MREELNRTAPRRMARAAARCKLVIENYPEDRVEELPAVNNPEDASAGTRHVPFSRELYIERDDFLEDPAEEVLPARAGPRGAAALRVLRDLHRRREGRRRRDRRAALPLRPRHARRRLARRPQGEGHAALGVGARTRSPAEVRLYETLFTVEDPLDVAEGGDFTANLNPSSLEVVPARASSPRSPTPRPASCVQFERLGYFCADPDSHARARRSGTARSRCATPGRR